MKLGILGGGQLARMLSLSAHPLGVQCRVLDPSPEAPAAVVAEHICAPYDDPAALERFSEGLDCVTYEFENIPIAALTHVREKSHLYPGVAALEASQDRLQEKQTLQSLGISTAEFRSIDSKEDLHAAVASLGLPAILKTRRMGYDGKGQFLLRKNADIDAALKSLGAQNLILEGFVPFDRELSIIGVRSKNGEVRCYPLVENEHRGGILYRSCFPAAQCSEAIQRSAEDYFTRLANALSYVGVLCIELFQEGDSLRVNEFAPRVHNSGHWSIEAAYCSQFENHVRAVLGLPLGSTVVRSSGKMFNILSRFPAKKDILSLSDVHLHDYCKKEKPNRKLGHITMLESNVPQTDAKAAISNTEKAIEKFLA